MDKIINFGLLKNPLNWAIVLLMLLIAGFAGHYILELAGVRPGSSPTSTT